LGLTLSDRNILWPYWVAAGLMLLGMGLTTRLGTESGAKG
jgi:hypothetical protein